MTDSPDIAALFGRPFPEQVAAYRQRLGSLVPTSRWDDIMHDSHDKAFMVAGAMKADLLADLAGAVDKAIADGTSLEAFRAEFRQIVDTRGWHGWTGESTAPGRAWRTRVIYRTNAATSYAAGRMAQLIEGNYPLWVYRHGGSLEPRPEHLSWDGLILPSDHPFWNTHAPPNGWGCSCYVLGARTMNGARRLGGDPDLVLPDDWQDRSPKTGVPVGIDRGWAYAPGSSVTDTVLALRDRLDELPEQPGIALIQSWLRNGPFATWLRDPNGVWPLLRLSPDDAAAIGAKKVVADLSAETARKQLREHPELSPQDYAMAQATVAQATHRVRDTPRSMVFIRDADDGHLLVVKATRSGDGLFVTSFRRISAEPHRRARLIRQILRRGS